MSDTGASYAPLTEAERRAAADLPVWIVWYEDRFGWGPDRDPAPPIAAYQSETEAAARVEAAGGEPDIERGKSTANSTGRTACSGRPDLD